MWGCSKYKDLMMSDLGIESETWKVKLDYFWKLQTNAKALTLISTLYIHVCVNIILHSYGPKAAVTLDFLSCLPYCYVCDFYLILVCIILFILFLATQTQVTLWQQQLCSIAGITLGSDGALIIERVKKDDEGLYECVATNVEGVARTSAVITVIGRSLTPGNLLACCQKKFPYVTAFFAAAVSQALCFPVAATSGFVSYFRAKVPHWSKKKVCGCQECKVNSSVDFYDGGSGWGSAPRGHDLWEVLRGPLMSAKRLPAMTPAGDGNTHRRWSQQTSALWTRPRVHRLLCPVNK